MLAGGCRVDWDDGVATATVDLGAPTEGLFVPPGTWIVLREFSPRAVCLVLASDHYKEDDYIRDYAEFRRLTAGR